MANIFYGILWELNGPWQVSFMKHQQVITHDKYY